MLTPQYIHLTPTASLESVDVEAPFAAVVTIDAEVTHEWRAKVSEWLVEKGCLYMMAHGRECSLWDDSVDTANLEAFNWRNIPENKLVTTKWHNDESLEEVLYFALTVLPFHPVIKHMVILEMSEKSRGIEILEYFKAAEAEYSADKENFDNSWQVSVVVLGGIIAFVVLPNLLIFFFLNLFPL